MRVLLGSLVLIAAALALPDADARPMYLYDWDEGGRTVADVLHLYGKRAEERLLPDFRAADVEYPPQRLALLGLKEERSLELWAESGAGWRLVKRYRIRGVSGRSGPKLFEGDGQIPEGLYEIVALNPNSSFHLSMKINYPNDFDLFHAQTEGRTRPGGNIFIHGDVLSRGCLAMGDSAIEELFVLVARVGLENARVLIAPYDPRRRQLSRAHRPRQHPVDPRHPQRADRRWPLLRRPDRSGGAVRCTRRPGRVPRRPLGDGRVLTHDVAMPRVV